jgi:hypothetical protein
MARCSSATWVRHLSPCALRPHQSWLIWFIRAQKQIWGCRSASLCGACPGPCWPQSTGPR